MKALIRQISPPGASALSVIEVAGPHAMDFLEALGVRSLPDSGRMRLANLDLGKGLREQALLVATSSGFEIQTHGNPLLVDAILARASATDPSEIPRSEMGPTEAGSRATWEQTILRLAREAPGRLGLRLALFQLEDAGLSGLVRNLSVGKEVKANLRACEKALSLAAAVRSCLRPSRIVLRGRVNAGKSTLFNLLVGRERVRTGPMPALTRDPVHEEILYRDRVWLLVDTAGKAEGLADLDRSAGQMAEREERVADLVLWLHSSSDRDQVPQGEQGVMILETHHPRPNLEALQLDLLHMDPDALRAHVLDQVIELLGLENLPPLAPAPLDESMEEDLRWLLDQGDPVAAARKLLGLDAVM